MVSYLDFEKPIAELQARVAELRETADAGPLDIDAEVSRLEAKADRLLRDTYARLTPWQKTQVARHPERRTSAIMSPAWSRISCRSPAIARSPTISRSSVASAGSADGGR